MRVLRSLPSTPTPSALAPSSTGHRSPGRSGRSLHPRAALALPSALLLLACGGASPPPAPSAPAAPAAEAPAASAPEVAAAAGHARAQVAEELLKATSLASTPHQRARLALAGLATSPEFALPSDVTEVLKSLEEWTLDVRSAKTALVSGLMLDTLLSPFAAACELPKTAMLELLSDEPPLEDIQAQCKVDFDDRFKDIDALIPEFVLLSVALESYLETAAPLTEAERAVARLVAELHHDLEDHEPKGE